MMKECLYYFRAEEKPYTLRAYSLFYAHTVKL